jgi:hypothetical protein
MLTMAKCLLAVRWVAIGTCKKGRRWQNGISALSAMSDPVEAEHPSEHERCPSAQNMSGKRHYSDLLASKKHKWLHDKAEVGDYGPIY